MTKAEALWKKLHIKVGVDSWEVIVKDEFLAALHEYGAEVRARDAEIVRQYFPANSHGEAIGHFCAAAISREPLP